MKKITLFLLVFSLQISSYSQSKRQQKFMVMNVSYEDAAAITALTIRDFLEVDLSDYSFKKDKFNSNIAAVKPYEFTSGGSNYKVDIYFEYETKNLAIKTKNFQYYDPQMGKYTFASLVIGIGGVKGSLRKKLVEYAKQLYNDKPKLTEGKTLYESLKNNNSPKASTTLSKKTDIKTKTYAKRGVQFDITQEKFLVGSTVDIIFSQTIVPVKTSTNRIYIVKDNEPRGKTVDYKNQITSKNIYSDKGKITLKLPKEPGIYEIRYAIRKPSVINEEVAYKTIHVEMPITNIKLTKNSFVPGEEIRANWSTEINLQTSSNISVVPIDVPHGSRKENSKHQLSVKYLKGNKGLAVLKAPSQEGTYTIRLSDYYSDKELASETFTISNAIVELKLEKKTFKAGEKIKVLFSSSVAPQNQGWVGILPSDIPHGNTEENKKHWIQSDNVTGKKEAIVYLKAPIKAGNYDIRMNYYGGNYSYNDGSELASVSIVVSENGTSKIIDNSTFKYSSINTISESLALGKSVVNEKVILNNINFNTGSAELTQQSKTNLKDLVGLLIKFPSLKLEISGHTDTTGNEDANLELSKKRAKAVVIYLIMNNAKPSNLSYEGYGQYKPIGDNNTSKGRLKNRRVEFEILNQ